MENLDTILLLMAALAVLYTIAEKIKISYPILLVVAGLAIGFIPGLPLVQLSPDVVFLIFLPPLLFDAARHTSWHDFKKNRDAIGRLAFGLVLFTAAAIAVTAYYMIPGFTWPLAFLLGAIVSPPDVVAATSAIKGLHLPRRMVTILEGESLVNDASALILYRYAVAAVFAGTFVFWEAGLQFLYMVTIGLGTGVLLGWAFIKLQKKFLTESTVETSMTLVLPFLSYLIAEHLGASGVLSVVATGLVISWKSHDLFSFQTRMQMNAFWDIVAFLLNGLVFILIGLQLHAIINGVSPYSIPMLIGYGLLISAVTIGVRIVWIYPSVYFSNLYHRVMRTGRTIPTNAAQLFIIGWSGMRGVVSLASALALPLTLENGFAFPQRDVILFITFVVILVTLVLQGLTLPFLVRYLKVQEPEEKFQNEEHMLRLAVANSSLKFIDREMAKDRNDPVIREMRSRIERQIAYLNLVLEGDGGHLEANADGVSKYDLFKHHVESEQALIDHQRGLIIDMNRDASFSEQALRRIEQEIDAWNMNMAQRGRTLQEEPITAPAR
ncbi:MAG: Na+/H+ antiporter [Micavibrio sp.]|nr:Na+/H+ antiporter [Micavibrio sp.]